jgi:hypothetical protein
MTPEAAAAASADAIHQFGSYFMLDPATYQRGAELGFDPMSFYFVGRGGVLGAVPGDVVAAALVFFEPRQVVRAWEASRSVMGPRDAAAIFVACGHTWARRLPGDLDLARLAELAGKLAWAAVPAGAPLFAAWRAMPEPEDPKALVLHRMHVVRELRGGWHGAAVLGAGLAPVEAVAVRDAGRAALLGWDGELPDPEPFQERWARASAMTDRLMATAFAGLAEDERAEFVDLADRALAAVKA